MARIDRIFNGRLDYDTHPFRVRPQDFIDGLNMTRDAQGANTDGPVTGIIGNQLVDYDLPAGTNKVIGTYPDKERNRIYEFVWNSEDYHSITYYDRATGTRIKIFENLTDSNDVDILGFNPSYKINHVDIIYKDSGDLISWTDGLNPPRQFNVTLALAGTYGVWEESYINVIKAPAQIPPAVVYENDATVTVNNLRKRLFKIKYEFEYDDFEKSVTSSQSELPLPVNYTDSLIDKDPTKNCKIAIVVQTGTARVKKIRILVAQSLGNVFSDYFLVRVIDKSAESIPNNDITTYRFSNDQAYNYIPVQQSLLSFDWVPQTAGTQCLPNGNVLCYGAITEGYDMATLLATSSVSSITQRTTQLPFIYAASQSGNSGFGTGEIHVVVIGSVVAGDTFNIYTTNQTITFVSVGTTTAAVIAGLAAAAVVAGFTVVSSDTENLVITKTGESLQRIYASPTTRAVTDSFVYDYSSRYTPAVIYFDAEGRTNGAIIKAGLAVQTPIYGKSGGVQTIPQLGLSISSRPPIEAAYYQILFTKNLTESTLLDWVSDRTYKDNDYAYIGIGNLDIFKDKNPTSPLGYEFLENDRIRFMQVLSGSVNTIYTDSFDFEILGELTNPEINGIVRQGRFLKFALPATSATFDFGAADFFNYFIKLYTPAQSVANGLDVYYEVGERYAIGNPFTANAFHQGMLQNQTSNLATPATFEFTKGDFYYRPRSVQTGVEYDYQFNDGEIFVGRYTLGVSFQSTNYIDPNITVGNSPLQDLSGWHFSQDTRAILKMGGAAPTTLFKFKGTISFDPLDDDTFNFQFVKSTGEVIYMNAIRGVTDSPQIQAVEGMFTLAANEHITPLGWSEADYSNPTKYFTTDLKITIDRTYSVGVVDPNFSDFFPSAVNSYGRAWVNDPDAAQTYYPTLRRNGGEYQQDTTTNNINRFYFDVQDTYNRQFGDIRKMFVNGSRMFVFQTFDIGVVPILIQVVQDVQGNPLQAQSDILLNKISYPYGGKVGIGNVPESFAHGNYAMYGVDNNRAIVWRLSLDGVTYLSILYKTNSFFVSNLAAYKTDLNNGIVPAGETYTGNPTVYGVYDSYTNKYIIALEEITRYSSPTVQSFHQDPRTISFIETRDEKEGFEPPCSFHPENMVCLDNLLVTYKDGATWTHDSDTYANFYGTQYEVEVVGVFNDFMTAKKTFQSLFETSGDVWTCPEITTNVFSYRTPSPTAQSTSLNESKFTELEGEFSAAFRRDGNSSGGLTNGDWLKGQYVIIKFRAKDPANFVFLNSASVMFIESPLNTK